MKAKHGANALNRAAVNCNTFVISHDCESSIVVRSELHQTSEVLKDDEICLGTLESGPSHTVQLVTT